MRSRLLILFYAVICIIVVFNEDKQDKNQFSSDVCGYYLYLPAVFIYHDLEHLGFYDSVDATYGHLFLVRYSLHDVNGKVLDKYPVGVAFFELPLFLVAHVYTHIITGYPDDGFSLPFQLAGIFSNILWVVAALFVLRRFLLTYFDDRVTAMTLMFIAFGTNLYAYSSFQVGMSHPYSFFLFCCILNVSGMLYSKRAPRFSTALCAFLLGLIFVVRPVNILIAIIPLFWEVTDITSLRQRITCWTKNHDNIIIAALFFLLPLLPQFFYWHYITGHWLFYSYTGEKFDFSDPHLIDGLFSYRKGWLLYTPMVILAVAGLPFLWKKDKKIVPAIIVFMILTIYAVFSWQTWWYGGSFGCRALIELLAVLTLPLGAVTGYFYYSKSKVKKYTYFSLAFFFVVLNMQQTYQYSMGLLHCDRMTKQYYWKIFGQMDAKRDNYEQYLINDSQQNTPAK